MLESSDPIQVHCQLRVWILAPGGVALSRQKHQPPVGGVQWRTERGQARPTYTHLCGGGANLKWSLSLSMAVLVKEGRVGERGATETGPCS